jgi:uncharacterized protein (DUF1684 family)
MKSAIIILGVLLMNLVHAAIPSEIEKTRKTLNDSLLKPTGWLSVVGLHWLKDGDNKIGQGNDVNVSLPLGESQLLGKLQLLKKTGRDSKTEQDSKYKVTFVPSEKSNGMLKVDGANVSSASVDVLTDVTGKKTVFEIGSVSFFLIERKNGVAVRVIDSNAQAKQKFTGRKWFDYKPEYRIEAKWLAAKSPVKIIVPDVIGNFNEEESPGYAEFTMNGVVSKLYPTASGDELFFVIRDQTSGKETYGASRFLMAKKPIGGKVVLEFNLAFNPPCAFTNYATCPLPPKENIMKVSILAGEKKNDILSTH